MLGRIARFDLGREAQYMDSIHGFRGGYIHVCRDGAIRDSGTNKKSKFEEMTVRILL